MFEITGRDKDGKPSHVITYDGFCQISRKYDQDTDGWMENQLNPLDFDAVKTGRDIEFLIAEVNHLRRENFRLEQMVKRYCDGIKL